jgi:hypothetical protein
VSTHALRWLTAAGELDAKPDRAEIAYDPFRKAGPWTVACVCGWQEYVKTRRMGEEDYRRHRTAMAGRL